MKEFVFYFPKLHRTRSIIAHDEATAVWKLFYQFKLRERDVDGYKIVAQGKISVKNLLRHMRVWCNWLTRVPYKDETSQFESVYPHHFSCGATKNQAMCARVLAGRGI